MCTCCSAPRNCSFTLAAPFSPQDSISPDLPERIRLSVYNCNSFFIPSLLLRAPRSLAAALTFGTFIIAHSWGRHRTVHDALQTQTHCYCSKEGPYQLKKCCARIIAGTRLMSCSTVIREKCKDVGEFIDPSLAELKLMPLSPGIASNKSPFNTWSSNHEIEITEH